MTTFLRPLTDQDARHMRLDLHKAIDGSNDDKLAFFVKWGRDLDEYLFGQIQDQEFIYNPKPVTDRKRK